MRFKKTAAMLGAGVLFAFANPAMAAGPIQIDVGANTSGTYSFTAISKDRIDFVVHHGAGTVNMGCSTASAAGTIVAGSSSTGNNVGTIGSSTWGVTPTWCEGPGGLVMNVTQNPASAWTLNLDLLPKPTAAVGDNITGHVGNISAHVWSKIPGACEFDVTGTADAIFHEKVTKGGVDFQQLEIVENSGNLVVSNVVGCLGAITASDTADFFGEYNVTSGSGVINVK